MKNLLFFTCLFFSSTFIFGQGFVYVNPISEDSEPDANSRSNNPALNNILDQYNVSDYSAAYPGYKTPLLKEIFIMKCEGDFNALLQALEGSALFETIRVDYAQTNETYSPSSVNPGAEDCSELYQVNDPLSTPGGENFWVVDELNLDCAWAINDGCEEGIIAFVDAEFEDTHDELKNQIIPPVLGANPLAGSNHGTKVSSLAVAEGNNGIGLAGVNPKGKIYGWVVDQGLSPNSASSNNLWQSIAAAALLDGVKVVNVSWISIQIGTADQIMVIEEMIANGVVPVFSSGDDEHSDTGWRNIRDIPGLIYVSGVEKTPWEDGPKWSVTTAHNEHVDILGPASGYWRAELGNTVGYFFGPGGNSAATAHVSGAISLMMCENPCLLPGDVQNILGLSGQEVPLMDLFPGELGSGLVSVETALLLSTEKTAFPDVTGNVTIDAPINVHSDIIIKNGGTLTINSLVHFNNLDDNIIVEKGGKLILDGAHLKNGCDNDYWGGIVVQGNPFASQYIPGGNVDQGTMIATNSTIENAKVGVNISNGSFNNVGGGGICDANGVTFKNCQAGVQVDDYPAKAAQLPHQLLPNRTTFRNCDFYFNDDLPFDLFYHHVLLDHANALVSIGSSTFSDSLLNSSGDFTTYGISSNDSRFTVNAGCEFNNLSYGVKAYTLSSMNNFRIVNSYFNDCFIGVSTRNVPFFTIEDNEFYIGAYSGSTSAFNSPNQPTGLIMDHSTGFRVEGNYFDGGNGANLEPIGILARNTSFGNTISDYNEIKENEFTKLRSGNLANENNGGNGSIGGLLYKCNKNLGDNEEDMTVAFGSIATNQVYTVGAEDGVDNEFSNWDNGNPYSDIDNATAANFIKYFYSDGPNFEPLFFPDESVMLVQGTEGCYEEDHCPKCIRLTPVKRDELVQFVNTQNPVFQSDYNTYFAKLDDGKTVDLIADLTSVQNWPQGKTNAIAFSPYVSLETAEAILSSTALPVQDKYDILIENPEIIQTAEVWVWINDNIDSTSYTISQLEQARSQTSARGQEELTIADLGRQLILASNALIRHYLYQDEETSPDMAQVMNYVTKYYPSALSVAGYLQNNDWSEASSLINTELQRNSNLELWTFYDLLKTNFENDDFSFSSSALANQADILENSSNHSCKQIGRNLKVFNDHQIDYQNEGVYTEMQRSEEQESFDKFDNVSKELLIYPNPANQQFVNVKLLGQKSSTGEISVFDTQGRLVLSQSTNSDQTKMRTGKLPSGIYFIIVVLDTGEVFREKMIIQ